MSLSKLESLPNEILLDILEKHVNGVDVLVAFADELNSRINGIISQCRQFRFDFLRCRMDDFRLCMSLFPSLVDRIEELTLSEWNTPGQIHAFLSFFPSFKLFINLHTLYFHFNAAAVNSRDVERALCSLMNLKNLNTLSIKVANELEASTLAIIVRKLFCLPTLKRLSVAIEETYTPWAPLESDSSNIEHLTITGVPCPWSSLRSIVRCATHLQYLNVRLTNTLTYLFQEAVPTKLDYASMESLRTLILYFEKNNSETFAMVAQFLRAAPNLYRLEITAHDALMNASAWEQLIKNALPHLTHFCLKTSPSRLERRDLQELLLSFQTSFWIEKINFHVLILDAKHLLDTNETMNHVCGRKRHPSNMHQNRRSNQQSTEFLMALVRPTNSSISPTNIITSLHFHGNSSLLSCPHFFNNVRYLIIGHQEKNLLEWITKHVNFLRIEELDISLCQYDQMTIFSLLTLTKNIKSLKLDVSQLIMYQASKLGTNNQLKSINLSCDKGVFNENIIQTIGQLFPHIEHIVIDTPSLAYIPMLATYLPHLRSLTCKNFDPSDGFEQNTWNYQCRAKTQFLFERDGYWLTIWLDSMPFDESYCKTLRKMSSPFVQRSPTTNDNRKKRFKF